MATGKRYYWIKLKKDFMTGDIIDYLMNHKNGSDYVVLYQMLCLSCINTEGKLQNVFGEKIVPYSIDKIRRECRYFETERITEAIKLYQEIGLVYEDQDGVICISDWGGLVGSETDYAGQKRSQRRSSKTGVDNVHTESKSKRESERESDTESEEEKEREAAAVSSSVSCHVMSPADNDKDADRTANLSVSLASYFAINNVPVKAREIEKLLKQGFDTDTLLWMMEKSQSSATNTERYFSKTAEDKKATRTTTIAVVREAECRSDSERKSFDAQVSWYRQDFACFESMSTEEYARQQQMRRKNFGMKP